MSRLPHNSLLNTMEMIKITKEQLEQALGGFVKIMIRDNDFEVLLDCPNIIEIAREKYEQLELKFKEVIEVSGQLELTF